MDIIMKSISAIESYAPTTYKNNSEPDLDEDNLNKTEQALKRVTDAVNEAINALKQLEQEKISVSDISNVQLNDQSKVPSCALAYAMQREVDKLNTQSDNLMMKITSGSMTETIGSLPTGKYSGYYSSGAADTPSNYGTFEAVVMNSSTATITAVDTSSGENYTKIKTSNTWKNWEKDITNSNLNGTGSSTVSHRTNAGGGWSSAKPSIVLEGTKGADEVIILSTMTVKDGKWYISASQKDNLLRFRYTSDSGGIVSQFSLDPDKKSAVWS